MFKKFPPYVLWLAIDMSSKLQYAIRRLAKLSEHDIKVYEGLVQKVSAKHYSRGDWDAYYSKTESLKLEKVSDPLILVAIQNVLQNKKNGDNKIILP